jgi:UDP-N-acetylmuramoylalanine--D-glutamate ligase
VRPPLPPTRHGVRPPLPQGPFLVVGLARSGVAAALALRARGETVIGLDSGSPSRAPQLSDAGVELHTEQPHGIELLKRVHALVKSPGVPARAPVVAAARALGVTVIGELELAWRMLPNEFIAVTGTNGKTTTVELIGHMHRHADIPVAVAGNVGVALSGLVDSDVAGRSGRSANGIAEGRTIVCEASSFQLEDTLAFAPEAAVLLNITPDHLDRHETFEQYAAAKLRIFARQGVSDLAVLPLEGGLDGIGHSAIERIGGSARRVRFGADERAELSQRGGELRWEGRPLVSVSELRLRGAHNLQNAMAAAAVCLARGVAVDAVVSALRDFPGVAHRLEEVSTIDGVLYINDSKATNIASTLVALDAMSSDGLPVHLILGGLGKGQDFAPLAASVQRGCRAIYLIGEDAVPIERALTGTDVPLVQCGELEQALRQAAGAALPGDVVLLSPGCASFDQFADFEARGERFRELVGGIRGSM